MFTKKHLAIVLIMVVSACLTACTESLDTMGDYDIRRFDFFVSDGATISLADVFPTAWDTAQILHSPGHSQLDRDETRLFANNNGIQLDMAEKFYLVIFRIHEKIVGLIDYMPGSSGPQFVVNGAFKENWVLEVSREDANFKCVDIAPSQHRRLSYSSADYELEYVSKSED